MLKQLQKLIKCSIGEEVDQARQVGLAATTFNLDLCTVKNSFYSNHLANFILKSVRCSAFN